jgi:hypothetical protein
LIADKEYNSMEYRRRMEVRMNMNNSRMGNRIATESKYHDPNEGLLKSSNFN